MAVQSYRAHSIHGPFGSAFAANSSLSSAQASSFTKLPNVSVNPHGKAANFFVPAARTRPTLTLQTASVQRLRRPAPPPPSRQTRAALTTLAEDPFMDQPIIAVVSPSYRSAPSSPPIASRTRIPPPVYAESSASSVSPQESHRVAPAKPVVIPPGIQPVMLLPEFGYQHVRGRLVACMLLNRNCGRPMRRRRPFCMAGGAYVPSALSRMVAVDSSA
ncbi:uncharacterized protein C8Q71DRAFT_732848 [Rhodofomes roseus]|uniref:Uncharacterized protein n=1 Tax=Rhodofomes roseus TaxID=34475 RepID=A0ABQ8KV80_9APHY|nr:uncharacterized protein C8Q71DRAFT_732848 [Rhodofomes roseus]KAH9842439.1 hypothetical protein C8Q71DRAFT_732848 [Rhodofomes roseus]